MNTKYAITSLILMGCTFSCSDETTVFQDDLQQNVVIENSEEKLQGSVSYAKSGVLGIVEEATITRKGLASKDGDQAGDYPLTLVAQIEPPTYPGRGPITATHVDLDGNFAYVSYNTAGATYFGAIQVINVSDPHKPVVSSQLMYLNADINSVEYENGYVYAVGGVDAELSATATSNAFVVKISCPNGKLSTASGITYGFQQGYNANDVLVNGNFVYVTSGKEGTLTAYNKNNMTTANEIPYADLRGVAMSNGNIALLDASSGVRVISSAFQTIKEIPIDTDFGSESKKTIDFQDDRIVVAEAGKGAGIYSYSGGNLLSYIPILINPEGVAASDINTNAVAFNEDVILMANGGAGLCLAEKDADNTDLYGIIDLEGSTNFVASREDYIFAASGREGLYIIKMNKPAPSLLSRCLLKPLYIGSSKLTVSKGQVKEYTGAKSFSSINVEGSLLLCGSWTSTNDVDIDDNGLFEMRGLLAVGTNKKMKDLKVEKGATFRVEGTLEIYGKLILEENATLEFIGPASIVLITGSVEKKSSSVIKGNFIDLNNKL